jgi:hypothetical protein
VEDNGNKTRQDAVGTKLRDSKEVDLNKVTGTAGLSWAKHRETVHDLQLGWPCA